MMTLVSPKLNAQQLATITNQGMNSRTLKLCSYPTSPSILANDYLLQRSIFWIYVFCVEFFFFFFPLHICVSFSNSRDRNHSKQRGPARPRCPCLITSLFVLNSDQARQRRSSTTITASTPISRWPRYPTTKYRLGKI